MDSRFNPGFAYSGKARALEAKWSRNVPVRTRAKKVMFGPLTFGSDDFAETVRAINGPMIL